MLRHTALCQFLNFTVLNLSHLWGKVSSASLGKLVTVQNFKQPVFILFYKLELFKDALYYICIHKKRLYSFKYAFGIGRQMSYLDNSDPSTKDNHLEIVFYSIVNVTLEQFTTNQTFIIITLIKPKL